MPEGMLLSDDLPINRRSIREAPHRFDEQSGMEGSTVYFATPYVVKADELPKIRYFQKEKNCCDCNNPTHLTWTTVIAHIRFRLCQGCARRRGNIYEYALNQFLRHHPKVATV